MTNLEKKLVKGYNSFKRNNPVEFQKEREQLISSILSHKTPIVGSIKFTIV